MTGEAKAIIIAAIAAAVLLGAVLALFAPLPEEAPEVIRYADPDPAAYAVAEVLEEARRITIEASE